MTRRAFVTGGTGFIGQHLVRALVRQGIAVRILVRPDSMTAAARISGAEVVVGDLLKPDSLSTALQDVTELYHLAGKLHLPGVTAEQYHQLHVDGTRNILTACLGLNSLQTIVHCSTTGVLGPTGSTLANEDAPYNPKTTYEQSKAASEKFALAFAREHGLPLTVTRPSLVYGPGDLHLLSWYQAIQRGWYRVVGSGDNLLHPIYIDDLVAGLLRQAERPVAAGRVYHIVGPLPVQIKELAAAIARAVGRPLPRWRLPLPLVRIVAAILEALPGIPPDRLPLTHARIDFMVESRAYCSDRARQDLGFIPTINLETGLSRTVAWYRQDGLL